MHPPQFSSTAGLSDPAGIKAASVLRVVLCYVVFASAWILGSDSLIGAIVSDPKTFMLISIVKGWAFVALTALMLYFLISRLKAAVATAQFRIMDALHLLGAITDSSPDAIFAKDVEGRYILINPAAAKLFGKECERLVGRHQAVDSVAVDDGVLTDGVVETLEESIATDDGERTFLTTKGPLRDSAGTIFGTLGVARDITDRKAAETQLDHERIALRTLVQTIPDLIWLKDPDGIFLTCNSAFERFFGVTGADLIGKPDEYLVDHEMAEFYRKRDREAVAVNGPSTNEEWLTSPVDGRQTLVETVKTPMRDSHGRLLGVLGVAREITAARRTEAALRDSEAMLKRSQRVALVGHYVLDVASGTWTSSEALDQIFGIGAGFVRDVEGWRSLAHPDDREEMAACIAEAGCCGGTGACEREFRILRRNTGEERWVHCLGVNEPSDSGDGPARKFGTIQDVTERKLAAQRIEFLAHHDPLTGLPNRLLARQRLWQAIARAEREKTSVALLFLDLDSFKTVNDTLGHASGDELLRSVAQRLGKIVRGTDTVSRQGGDEFLIVLADLPTPKVANVVVDNLIELLQAPFDVAGQELTTSVSIGIAVYPDDGRDFETLRKKADMAMYRAKDAGRNTYRFFDDQMNVDGAGTLRLRNGLRRALDHDEFVLHFQPKIDLASRAVIGAEALIRWNDPQMGMVPPAKFIPVAENSGMIVPIGDWVLREACRQAAHWQRSWQQRLVVAVNLSAAQFQTGTLERSVTTALEWSGLDPSLLELELTESLLIRDTETVLATVRRLKSLGIHLAIDDFGTGYSSLAYLKRFAVDKLKIDQSFVRDVARDAETAAIVRAIIQMARSLNLKTVAEGIEDAVTLDHLVNIHCDEAQGYYFARPMPAEDFAKFLTERPTPP